MITLCIPSRGRPKLARRMYDSAIAQSNSKKNLEFLFYLNEDDPSLPEYLNLLNNLPQIKIQVGPHQSTSFSWNRLATRAMFDIICLMGDDVQIETKDWDRKIYEQFSKYDDKILMVVPQTGRPRGYRQSQWKSKESIRLVKKNEPLPPSTAALGSLGRLRPSSAAFGRLRLPSAVFGINSILTRALERKPETLMRFAAQ